MNSFSLAHLLAALVYLFLGLYGIRQAPRVRANRFFLLTCLCFALWSFSFAFMHASTERADIDRWYDISAPGWCMYSALSLHFIMALLKRDALLRKKWFSLLLYGPGAVLIIKEVTGTMAAVDFMRVGPGYSECNPIDDPWYWFFLAYQTGVSIYGFIVLTRWGVMARLRRERRQALWVAVPALVSLVLAFTSDILLPALRIFMVPALSPLVVLIWAAGSWIAITRYRLISVTIENASEEIVKRIQDVLFLVDLDGRIMTVNDRITDLLGFDGRSMLHRPFLSLVHDGERLKDAFVRMIKQNEPFLEIEGDLISVDGECIPVHIGLSIVRDRFGDPAGIVVVGTDIREKRQLLSEVVERIRTEEVLRQRNQAVEKDLRNAQIIQHALLPSAVPMSDRVRVDFRNYSMDAVGGDYFAFTQFPDGEIGVFIGDVTGHGVSAALFLALLKATYDRISRMHGLLPGAFLTMLNNELVDSMPHYFLTGIYGYFSFPADGRARFTFATGGHPNPLHYVASSNSLSYVSCRGPLMGKFAGITFPETTIVLEKGDRLFLYTDGMIEARNAVGAMLGFPAFHALVDALSDRTLSETLDGLIAAVTDFRGPIPAEDDMVIIGIEIR